MYDAFDPDHRVIEPKQSLQGLHPRGLSMPNIMRARKAKAVGHRYLTLNSREGRLKAHRDPICTRTGVSSDLLDSPVFDYGDGQLIAFRGGDDPIFIDECPLCEDTTIPTSEESNWKADAACNVPGLDLSGHFINPGNKTDFAAQLCGECPVRSQCGEYGAKLQDGQPRDVTVIWGGQRTTKGRENEQLQEA